MTGHSPFATVKAVEDQMKRGITLMLPSEDAIFVSEELQQRFGLPFWQFALTATDATVSPFARPGISRSVRRFWCSTGAITAPWTKSFITLKDGVAQSRRGNIGPPVDPTLQPSCLSSTTWLRSNRLCSGDVACVLAEAGYDQRRHRAPDPGYHQALRELTKNSARFSSSTRPPLFVLDQADIPELKISIPIFLFR